MRNCTVAGPTTSLQQHLPTFIQQYPQCNSSSSGGGGSSRGGSHSSRGGSHSSNNRHTAAILFIRQNSLCICISSTLSASCNSTLSKSSSSTFSKSCSSTLNPLPAEFLATTSRIAELHHITLTIHRTTYLVTITSKSSL